MPTINQLNSIDAPNSSDLLPVYSQNNGDARKLSMSNLLDWIEANLPFPVEFPQFNTQYATPSSNGFTVTVNNSSANAWLILSPTAGFSTGTIVLPSASVAIDKQEVLVNCTQAVTSLTINGNGAAAVTGEPIALSANDFFRLRYDQPTHSWYRVG